MYLFTALLIVPNAPLLETFAPFLSLETVLVTVPKAFLELVNLPGFPRNFERLIAFIPALIAELNLEGRLLVKAG